VEFVGAIGNIHHRGRIDIGGGCCFGKFDRWHKIGTTGEIVGSLVGSLNRDIREAMDEVHLRVSRCDCVIIRLNKRNESTEIINNHLVQIKLIGGIRGWSSGSVKILTQAGNVLAFITEGVQSRV